MGKVLKHEKGEIDQHLDTGQTNVWCYAYWTLKHLANDIFPGRTVADFDMQCEQKGANNVNSMENYIVWFNDHEETDHADITTFIGEMNDPENIVRFFKTSRPKDINELYWGDYDYCENIRESEEMGYDV